MAGCLGYYIGLRYAKLSRIAQIKCVAVTAVVASAIARYAAIH